MPSDQLAQTLVAVASILLLPGTMFRPQDDPSGAREVRIAFANVNRAEIGRLFDRLEGLSLPLAPTGVSA